MTANAADTVTTKTALFAGGCFWCMQPEFDNTQGVVSTRVGYAGGDAKTANYEAVSTGKSGHVEVIQVTYDPAKVTYEKLLQVYWENIDPTDPYGQFADRGSQYVPLIYYADAAQQTAAQKSKTELQKKFEKPILVDIVPTTTFYAAEEYHQRYYEKNKLHYNAYKQGSGRADYLKRTWGEKK